VEKQVGATADPKSAAKPPPATNGNGVRWKQLSTVKDNTKKEITCSFRAVRTKLIRMHISRPSAAEGPDRLRLAEVLFFGPEGIVMPGSCEPDTTQEGFNVRSLCDGDTGYAEGRRKRGWASEPAAEHTILFHFRKAVEIFQVKVTTVDEEANRVRDFVIETPR
jgi:hypothetical protein